MSSLKLLFENARNIAILPHDSIDGDALCSSAALAEFAKSFGKRADIIFDDDIPVNLKFLNVPLLKSGECTKEYDTVIAADCGDAERAGERKSFFDKAAHTAVIDHHVTNEGFGDINIIKPHSSSTCEIVFDIFRENGICPDMRAAEFIYGGMLTDTGGFRYSNTSADTLFKAAELLKLGVPAAKLCEKLLETKTLSQLKIESAAVDSAVSFDGGRTLIACITKEMIEKCGASDGEMGGISSVLRTVAGVETSVTLKEKDEKIRVSMRTNGKVSAAEVCRAFGGGGHERAAGATLSCTMDEALNAVIEEIHSYERNN